MIFFVRTAFGLILQSTIYFISFAIVSQYWVYHQELLSGIKKATPMLTITNIYYLCFISLTPFGSTTVFLVVTVPSLPQRDETFQAYFPSRSAETNHPDSRISVQIDFYWQPSRSTESPHCS
ncbi:DUF1211 domain-containing protein [Lactobacillus helveticus]